MGRFTGAGAASGAGISFPVGMIALFAGVGATPPAGWLLCDGSAVSRTTFSNLFAAIGVLYGVGDGSTTFNLPKFDDNRKARGAVNDAARGTTGGVNSITQTVAQMPEHDHLNRPSPLTFAGTADGAGGSSSVQLCTTTNQSNRPANLNTDVRGGGSSMDNQSLFVDVNYLIHV